MKDYSLIIFVAVSVFFVDEVTALLRCRACNGARNLDDCPSMQVCSHDEHCFMDLKISANGNNEFWGGCRSILVCPSTGKKKSDLVACSKCCARDDCNIKLCHFPTTKPINTTRCWSCPDGVNDPRNCNHVALCADNEMCHSGMMTFPSGNHSVLHKTGCVRRQFCTTLTMAVMEVKKYQELHNQTHTAKRETGICDICCGTDMCNGTPCTVIRDYLYALYKSGKLNNETLTVQTHHP